jgi:hypothetical protein
MDIPSPANRTAFMERTKMRRKKYWKLASNETLIFLPKESLTPGSTRIAQDIGFLPPLMEK